MDSDQWSVVRRIPKQFRERGKGKWEEDAECKMQNAELGIRDKGKGDPQ